MRFIEVCEAALLMADLDLIEKLTSSRMKLSFAHDEEVIGRECMLSKSISLKGAGADLKQNKKVNFGA